MPKLVTKFGYLKGKAKRNPGGYAKYVATREGVEKIDESFKLTPRTQKQADFIAKILKDFPDTKQMHEYTDYEKEPNLGNATEFITRAIEDHAHDIMQEKTYADYIATRPRVEKIGTHGLFTDDGIVVKLNDVSAELNQHEGNVWTCIISLRREDAERLSYDLGERWRDMLRSHAVDFAENLKIPLENFHWYAAFHNESHHPHVHMMMYSTVENEGFLTKKGIDNLRRILANDIFAQDQISIYREQTERRDTLRVRSNEVIADIVRRINEGGYENEKIEQLLTELAKGMEHHKGKAVYGYLNDRMKNLVDAVVDELSSDERIASLYDLWYEKKEEVLRVYTDEMPKRIPMSKNTEFKSIRNAVIKEVLDLMLERDILQEPDFTEPPNVDPEDDDVEADESEIPKNKWELYRAAKEKLDCESEEYDPQKGLELMMDAAKLGCTVAKYQLGKLFAKGEHFPKNISYALRWLEEAAEEKNQYAENLLGKMYLQGDDVEQDLDKAMELLKRSADQGNKYASYAIAKALLFDEDLPVDTEEAIKRLTASADKGFAPAEYLLGKLLWDGELIEKNAPKALEYLERAAEKGNSYAAYLAGKILLTDETVKDVKKAIHYFEIAAEQGNDYAQFQFGRLYLFGKEIPKDYDKAMEYLKASAENGNKYAENLQQTATSNRNWYAGMGVFRLFHHLSKVIQDKLDPKNAGRGLIDRKLRRQINEKKQAQGLKLE